MSKKKKLLESTTNEIGAYDETIDNIKKLTDGVPSLIERRMDAETRLKVIGLMPDDVVDENANILLTMQEENEKDVKEKLLGLSGEVGKVKSVLMISSSGTSSAYVGVISAVVRSSSPNEWTEKATNIFNGYYVDRSRIANLPDKLDMINIDLGKSFSIANSSYEKACVGIINVDQAATEMRNVLNQLWAGLLDLARKKSGKPLNNYEFKTEGHRHEVVRCLVDDDLQFRKLSLQIDSAYGLFSELSVTYFGKNNLGVDIQRLKNDAVSWRALILDIVDIVNI
jgi:hypothetical protein